MSTSAKKFYLVSYTGTPAVGCGYKTIYRLFPSAKKAEEYVRNKTSGSGWETHPDLPAGSMWRRRKQIVSNIPNYGEFTFTNSYEIVALNMEG